MPKGRAISEYIAAVEAATERQRQVAQLARATRVVGDHDLLTLKRNASTLSQRLREEKHHVLADPGAVRSFAEMKTRIMDQRRT